jgi:hypothetical protein
MSNRAAPYAHLFGIARKTAKPVSTSAHPKAPKAAAKPKAAPTKPKRAEPSFNHLRPVAPTQVALTPAQRCDRRGDAARAALPTPSTIQRPGPRQSAPEVANPDRVAAQILAAARRRRGEA